MAKSVHPLGAIDTSAAHPGDFGVSVKGQTVLVSPEIYDACGKLNIRTAEALLNTAEAFPSSVAAALGWTVQDVQRAVAGASQRLGDVIDVAYLTKTPRPQVSFGAFPPLARDPAEEGSS